MTPVLLDGPAALSTFALAKVQAVVPHVVYAEFVHLLELKQSPTPDEQLAIDQLLSYGPTQDLPVKQGTRLVTVLPRSGTISPWSSKASDIFGRCGLDIVARVERGLRWYVAPEVDLSQVGLDSLHDRMTEQCWSEENFDRWFDQAAPKSVERVSVLEGGLPALAEANTRLGLALSEDEFDYLLNAYQKLQRDPTCGTDDVCSGQLRALPA